MDEQNLSNQAPGQPFNPPLSPTDSVVPPMTTTTTSTPSSTTTTTTTSALPTAPEIQWPSKKPKNNFKQIVLGVLAILFVGVVAGAAYYVSNQLSTRKGVGSGERSFAATGCSVNPAQCSAKEVCINNVCKPKPTATQGYTCTPTNCPAPAFYCSNNTCMNAPGMCGGKPCAGTCNVLTGVCTTTGSGGTGVTVTPTKAVSCESYQKLVNGVCHNTICGDDSGCTAGDRCLGGTCVAYAATCVNGSTTKVACTTGPNGTGLAGTRTLTCANNCFTCGAMPPCVANISVSTCPANVDCNVPSTTSGSSACKNSSGNQTYCCSTTNPEYSAASGSCKPAGSSLTNVCALGLTCGPTAVTGSFTCKQTATSTVSVYCCHAGETIVAGKCTPKVACPASDCQIPSNTPGGVSCNLSNGTATTCCPSSTPLFQNGKCINKNDACNADQKLIGGVCHNTICGTDAGCTAGDKCISGSCVIVPTSTCSPGQKTTVTCKTPISNIPNNSALDGTMTLTCCTGTNSYYSGCNSSAVCIANPSKSTCPVGVDCNLPAGTTGASSCNNSSGAQTLCCSTANPEYSATSKACKPAGGYTGVCATGLCCTTAYTSGAFTCKSSSTATTQDRFCCHAGEAISGGKCIVSANGCAGGVAPTSGGGATATPTKPGGGGTTTPTCVDTTWSPDPSTVCTTTTALTQTSNCGTTRKSAGTKICATAGACMEINMYSQKSDGTFNTTPMTTAEKNNITVGKKIRLAIKGNKASLEARFKISLNDAVITDLPGAILWPDAANQRPKNGYMDPTSKLISYYDFTVSKPGNYKFEGFMSTKPVSQSSCGGVAGIKCPTGFKCQVPTTPVDAMGVCIAN